MIIWPPNFHLVCILSIRIKKEEKSNQNPQNSTNIRHSIQNLRKTSIICRSLLWSLNSQSRSRTCNIVIGYSLNRFSQLKTFPIWVWLPGKYTGISIHDVLVNGIHIICCSPPLKYVFLSADIEVKRFCRIIRINKCIQHEALNYCAVIISSIAYCWSWTAVDEYFNIGKWFWGELVASEFEELVIG